MKKILFSSAFLFLFGLSSFSVFAGSFPDVPADHENYKAIEYLKEKEVISGYLDGTFGPENGVNRAEAMKILAGAFGLSIDGEFEASFPDVNESDWFFSYIMAAKKAGIVHGYDDGRFKPGDGVNLAESLKMALASAGIEVESVSGNVFTDVEAGEWYAPQADYAKKHNIVLPDEEGQFNGAEKLDRAKFAEVIYRLMIVKESGEKPFPLESEWKVYKSVILPFEMKYDSAEWKIIEHADEVIFFRQDKNANDFSPTRIYPNAAMVKITLDKNDADLGREEYFANLRSVFDEAKFTEFNLGGLRAIEVLQTSDRTIDWYIYMENGMVLALFTEFGNGPYSYTLQEQTKAMLRSFAYNPDLEIGGVDYEEILSEIFSNVLVEGKGTEMFALLPDEIIIETDAIGVGTGPIDYYYSEEVDYTFKYERTSDTILDKKQGRTNSF